MHSKKIKNNVITSYLLVIVNILVLILTLWMNIDTRKMYSEVENIQMTLMKQYNNSVVTTPVNTNQLLYPINLNIQPPQINAEKEDNIEEIETPEIPETIEADVTPIELVPYEIFMSGNVTKPSELTPEQLKEGLFYELKELAPYFIEAEQKYGVNAIFLSSIAAYESGWGRSKLATNRNNLFGWKGSNGYRSFSSKQECIMHVAEKLANNYLSQDGCYYNGTSVNGISVCYCESDAWANQVTVIAKQISNRVCS